MWVPLSWYRCIHLSCVHINPHADVCTDMQYLPSFICDVNVNIWTPTQICSFWYWSLCTSPSVTVKGCGFGQFSDSSVLLFQGQTPHTDMEKSSVKSVPWKFKFLFPLNYKSSLGQWTFLEGMLSEGILVLASLIICTVWVYNVSVVNYTVNIKHTEDTGCVSEISMVFWSVFPFVCRAALLSSAPVASPTGHRSQLQWF